MTARVGAKGQIVIPKPIRERLGIHPGTEVDIAATGTEVVVTLHQSGSGLGGRFQRSGMVDRLLADRASEPR